MTIGMGFTGTPPLKPSAPAQSDDEQKRQEALEKERVRVLKNSFTEIRFRQRQAVREGGQPGRFFELTQKELIETTRVLKLALEDAGMPTEPAERNLAKALDEIPEVKVTSTVLKEGDQEIRRRGEKVLSTNKNIKQFAGAAPAGSDVFEGGKKIGEVPPAPVDPPKAVTDIGKIVQDHNAGFTTPNQQLEQLRAVKGKNDPSFANQRGLRNDFIKSAGPFIDVRDNFARILGAGDDAAGDLALIFSFMKLLDPTSVVRESEQASAANAAGVPERIRNLFNKISTGVRLTPDQRVRFKKQGGKIFGDQLLTHRGAVREWRRIAEENGLDPNLIIVDLVGSFAEFGAPDFNNMSVEELGGVDLSQLTPLQIQALKEEIQKRIKGGEVAAK